MLFLFILGSLELISVLVMVLGSLKVENPWYVIPNYLFYT